MGYDTKDIIIDVVLCYNPKPKPQTVSKDAITNFMDGRDIRSNYVGMGAIAREMESHNDVDYRYYFGQHYDSCTSPLDPEPFNIHLFDFRNETTWCLQEVGRIPITRLRRAF